MREEIIKEVNDGVRAIEALKEETALAFMEEVSITIYNSFRAGGKILIAGNGGSLSDATHFAEEFSAFFRDRKRKALPAIALADSSHMSCVANDVGYDQVFARGVEAFGNKGDVFVALTTSGNSQNLIEATKMAKSKNLKTVTFLGRGGGLMKGLSDHELIIDNFQYADHIQEAHMCAIHIIIGMVEKLMLSSQKLSKVLAHA